MWIIRFETCWGENDIEFLEYLDEQRAIGRPTGKPGEMLLEYIKAGGYDTRNSLRKFLGDKFGWQAIGKNDFSVDAKTVPLEYRAMCPFMKGDRENDNARRFASALELYPGSYFFIPGNPQEVTIEEYLEQEHITSDAARKKRTEGWFNQIRESSDNQDKRSFLEESIRTFNTVNIVIRIDPKNRQQKVTSDMRGQHLESVVYGHVLPWEIIALVCPSSSEKDREGNYIAQNVMDVAKRVGLPVYDSGGKSLWPTENLL